MFWLYIKKCLLFSLILLIIRSLLFQSGGNWIWWERNAKKSIGWLLMDSTGQGQKRWVRADSSRELHPHFSLPVSAHLTFQYLVIDLCVTDVTDVCKRLAGSPSFCWCQQFEVSNDDCLGWHTTIWLAYGPGERREGESGIQENFRPRLEHECCWPQVWEESCTNTTTSTSTSVSRLGWLWRLPT